MMRRPRARLSALAGAAIAAALVLPALGAPSPPASGCSSTTLAGTVVRGGDGRLSCGPGEDLVIREELRPAAPSRIALRSSIASFFTIAEPALLDEESPLRAEFLDACGQLMPRAFRPHESLIPALIDAQLRAASSIALTGSPVLRDSYDFAVGLGSATEGRQRNELDLFVDLLNGGLIDPDSGSDGYEGVQGADPRGATAIDSPVARSTIRDLANEPFVARGLRAGAAPLPWYSVLGQNDARTLGQLPADPAIDQIATAWATGGFKLNDIGSQYVQNLCHEPSLLLEPGFLNQVAADPGAARPATPDPRRALLDRAAWVERHLSSGGIPAGHGFGGTRCTSAGGETLDRACYTFDHGPVTFIALDTTPSGDVDAGTIDAPQFAWLQRTLVANSSSYTDEDGGTVTTGAKDRIIVVMGHRAASPAATAAGEHDATDLRDLLLRFPNVVLHLTTGAHRVTARTTESGGYWEVRTAPASVWPAQTRSIELADNHDGSLSIISVLVDAAAPADPRSMGWLTGDSTDELAAGGDTRINETWLASVAREVAANDPQRSIGIAGQKTDRNVELVVRNPLGVTPPVGPTLPDLPTIPGFPTVPTVPSFPAPQFPGIDIGSPPPPAIPPTFQPPATIRTGPGLAVRPSGNGGWGGIALRYLGLASLGGLWLAGGRVRRWMVGI